MNSKKQLAVFLSKLASFDNPRVKLEQYPTDSEVAAQVLWFAYQLGDIDGKVIADLGCGTGILGIGALQFNPQKVYFVDIDRPSINRVRENLQLFDSDDNYELIESNIRALELKVDVVIQNPPFGVKDEHADKVFLKKAFDAAPIVYSFHKTSTRRFVESYARDSGFKVTHFFRFDFPLKQTQSFHTRKLHRIAVGCWRFEKI